jgi:hypothetical protein
MTGSVGVRVLVCETGVAGGAVLGPKRVRLRNLLKRSWVLQGGRKGNGLSKQFRSFADSYG